jgi:acyl carrier protein
VSYRHWHRGFRGRSGERDMITEELKRVLLAALKLDDWDITVDTRASDVPGWDSLNHVNAIMAVEKHCQVRFQGCSGLETEEHRRPATARRCEATGSTMKPQHPGGFVVRRP